MKDLRYSQKTMHYIFIIKSKYWKKLPAVKQNLNFHVFFFYYFFKGCKENMKAENWYKAVYFPRFSTPSISLKEKNEQLCVRNLFPRDS